MDIEIPIVADNDVVELSRSAINTICDAVLPLPAFNEESSEMATKVFRERLRKQLIGKKLVNAEAGMSALIDYVTRRQSISTIKDYTRVGLQSSEAISRVLAQSSQDAFKVVGDKKKVIASIVDTMRAVTSTVKDRKDQKVTIHFDQSYSKYGNFTLDEVVAMRSVFIQTNLKKLMLKRPKVGILEEFKGDKVSKSLRKLRQATVDVYKAEYIEPGTWNKLVIKTPKGINFSQSVLIMRFYFDHEMMYARNVSMLDIIKQFKGIIDAEDYNISLAASSMRDGIVDVCVNVGSSDSLSLVDHENLTLDSYIKEHISAAVIGGIPKVNDMRVHQVDLLKMFDSPKKPHIYTLAELGKKYLIEALEIEDEKDISEFESKIFVSEERVKGSTFLIKVDGIRYYYNPKLYGGYKRPTDQQLANVFAQYYCKLVFGDEGGDVDNLWVFELKVFSLKAYCIDYDPYISRILKYCELEHVKVEDHELMNLPYYIYVHSKDDPSELIKKRFAGELSKHSWKMIQEYSNAMGLTIGEDRDKFYKDHKDDFHKRLTKYVYAEVAVDKKGVTKQEKTFKYFDKYPYEQHVMSHAYTSIIKIPFVDRYKTTCNDWFTTTYTLGVDCARNNYTNEFYNITKESSSTDQRHIELFCDVVFEKGFPAGAGHYSSYVHDTGTTSQLSGDQQKSQLSKSFNRGPESAKNADVATLFGAPHIALGVRERYVLANERLEREKREEVFLRTQRTFVTSPADTEQSLDLSVKAMYIISDPFNVVANIAADANFDTSNPFEDFSVLDDDYVIEDIPSIVSAIRTASLEWLDKLNDRKSYVQVSKKQITLSDKSGVINITPLCDFLRTMAMSPFI
jgi:hypothetical protein